MIDQGPKSADQSPAGGDARRQPDPGSTPGGSTHVDALQRAIAVEEHLTDARRPHPLETIANVIVNDGLSLGILAMASGDLDTGGRVPSIDQLRRAGDAVIARRGHRP